VSIDGQWAIMSAHFFSRRLASFFAMRASRLAAILAEREREVGGGRRLVEREFPLDVVCAAGSSRGSVGCCCCFRGG